MINKYDNQIKLAVARKLPFYDWRLLKAQYWQESRLDPYAESYAGAMGIAQFMPGTWEDWSKRSGCRGMPRTNADASIITGAYYMDYLIGQWTAKRPEIDRYALAMASYNAGLGNILKAQRLANNVSDYASIIKMLPNVTGDNAKETIDYVQKIFTYYFGAVVTG